MNVTKLCDSLTYTIKKGAIRILPVFLIIAVVGTLLGGRASAEETVSSLELQVPSTSLFVEDTPITLTASANIQGQNSQKDVTAEATWTSSSSSVKVNKGVVTATGAASSVTISAKYGGKTASAIVNAAFKYDSVKLKISEATPVDAADSLDVDLDASLQFGAVGVLTNGNEETVTNEAQWTTSNSNVATVSNGIVSLLNSGKVTIAAMHKGKSDSISLTVASPYSSLTVTTSDGKRDTVEINIGDNDVQLQAKAVPKAGSSTPLDVTSAATWTSSNNGVVKVSDNGAVTAIGPGTAVVTAKRFGVSDSITFIVRTYYEGMKLTPDKPIAMTLYGADVELVAEMGRGNTQPETVSTTADWKVADPFIGSIDKKSDDKVYFIPKGVGSSKITATYKGLSKDISVTVYPTIDAVEISKDSLDVFVEDDGSLPTVSGVTMYGETKDISKLVKWRSADNSIISIEDGKWTAKKAGAVTLTATVENGSNATGVVIKEDTITVEVHKKVLTLIPATDNISVVTGEEADYPAVQLIYEDGEEEMITDKIAWKSSSVKLLAKSTKMKGLLPVTATLTGTYLNQTVKIKVQVEEEFTSFQIVPKSISVTLNRSQSIRVTGITKSGKKVTLSSRVDWISSNEDLVTINGSYVKGIEEGSGKLKANVQGKTLEIPYTVTAKLTKLTSSETSLQSKVGQSEKVTISALYENDKTANATGSAAWTTSNAKVATVSAGTITMIGKGSAYVRAAFGGKTITIRVSVK